MIETQETGNIDFLNNNIIGYYKTLTEDPYKEILSSFFPKGAKYKNDNLLGSFFSNKETLTDPKIGTKITDIDKTFKLFFKLTAQDIDGSFIILVKDKLTDDEVFSITFDDPMDITEDATIVNIDSSSWDDINKELSITFTFVDIDTMPTQGFVFEITNPDTEYYGIKQFLIVEDNPTSILPTTWDSLPILDCSDFVSFLWAAKQGYIIKKKVFTCKSLIEEQFDEIEDVEEIGFNNVLKNYDTIEELFEKTKNGDIFVFQENTNYHCIFITNINKKEYTECSSFVSYWLGENYNCTINPYPLKDRVLQLFNKTKLTKVRLL